MLSVADLKRCLTRRQAGDEPVDDDGPPVVETAVDHIVMSRRRPPRR
jgi:hypothetical protein